MILPLVAVLTLHVDADQLGGLRAVGQAPLLPTRVRLVGSRRVA